MNPDVYNPEHICDYDECEYPTSPLLSSKDVDCLPFRIKKVIYYNAPKIFEAMFKVFSEWLNEKIKSRVMMVGTDMNQAFDALPGLKDLMPESYGGNVKMTFEEICGIFLYKIVPTFNDFM
nr:alpha tocopherol transfer protein [Hymenolepis microstoma]